MRPRAPVPARLTPLPLGNATIRLPFLCDRFRCPPLAFSPDHFLTFY
jgi:hypothetical protein